MAYERHCNSRNLELYLKRRLFLGLQVCAGGEQSVENLFVLQSFVLQQLYLNVRKKKVFPRL